MPEGAKVDSGNDFFNAFETGKVGMIGTGAFAQATMKANHPEIEFGVTYLPGQNGGKSSFAGGDSIAIPKGSKYVKEAFEFIQWTLSDNVQLEQFAKNSQLPVRTDLAKNKYFDADPRLEINANAMAVSPRAVYAGTLDRGLAVYSLASGRWNYFTAGLPSHNVTAVEARGGVVYIGTDNGLVKVPESSVVTP